MKSILIIPVVFLALIVMLIIWAIIFMKGLKQDKKRLTTLFFDDKDSFSQDELYIEMAKSYENKGDFDKALEYYYIYLRKVPHNGEICYHVGNLLKDKKPEEAVEYWERAAKYGHKEAIEKLRKINEEK